MLKTIVVFLALGATAFAQTPAPQTSDPLRLPPMRVTVFKDLEDAQRVPASVSAVTGNMIDLLEAHSISEASVYSPNTFFPDFTVRKLSNPVFRGIGSGPANPGVMTYLDGVPQLNTNSSSVEFLDIEQVEFARGPFSALFGRNTMGGVINVTSRRPSLKEWTGGFTAMAANYGEWDERASVSGPLSSRLGFSLTAGAGGREGFTVNDTTGNDLDHRFASYGKTQLWWVPSNDWEMRLIVSGERARDGDYAFMDLGALQANPFHAARDYEGETRRDIFSATLLNRMESARFTITTTTGIVYWKTFDDTDLDYDVDALPGMAKGNRQNAEKDFQFTQEFLVAANEPVRLSKYLSLKWQIGGLAFTQNYDQNSVTNYAADVLFTGSPAVAQTAPLSSLDDIGFGIFARGTLNYKERLDVTATVRGDREVKYGDLFTSYDPLLLPPPPPLVAKRIYQSVSPQFAAMYHFEPGSMVYISSGRGYKAGGFNAVFPPGQETYNEESAWHMEVGAKAAFAKGRITTAVDWFFIDWNDRQFFQPAPPPAINQFYASNIGDAHSKGAEFEIKLRPLTGVDVFFGWGVTRARFDPGTFLNKYDAFGTATLTNVSKNFIPNTPLHTFIWGFDVARSINKGWLVYSHFDTWFSGGFNYDEFNTAGQAPYSLTTLSAGTRGHKAFFELFVKNASDGRYIPIAFANPRAPSGYIGEMGAPRRYGFKAGLTF